MRSVWCDTGRWGFEAWGKTTGRYRGQLNKVDFTKKERLEDLGFQTLGCIRTVEVSPKRLVEWLGCDHRGGVRTDLVNLLDTMN